MAPKGIGARYVNARKTSTAATTGTSSPPATARAPTRPNSMTPRPPGVTGNAVSRRATANAPSASPQLTSASGTPTCLSAMSSTANSEAWLSNAAPRTFHQPPRSSSTVSARHAAADSPHPDTGRRPKNRRNTDAAEASHSPTSCADLALLSATAKTTTAPLRTAAPTTDAVINAGFVSAPTANTTRAIRGRLNLANRSATPETTSEEATTEGRKPHDV